MPSFEFSGWMTLIVVEVWVFRSNDIAFCWILSFQMKNFTLQPAGQRDGYDITVKLPLSKTILKFDLNIEVG